MFHFLHLPNEESELNDLKNLFKVFIFFKGQVSFFLNLCEIGVNACVGWVVLGAARDWLQHTSIKKTLCLVT